MCGISGLVPADPAAFPDPAAAISRMTAALIHRGPDASGVWSDRHAFLGHRRLSILDIAGGAQPMVGDSGCVIVFNGEIYNYRELRDTLEAEGERFRTACDTEVLLKAFERYGENCLDRLVGMFAFAVWDPRRRRLFLARDRLGKKPLFYYLGPAVFAFASEIKGLLALDPVRQGIALEPRAVSDFLSLGYILAPKTIFANILKLPAAHCAVYDAESGDLALREYWRLDERVNAPKEPYSVGARQRFGEIFENAVDIRLRSDVPLGGYLSGGLDSSSVAAAMMHRSAAPTRFYCVGFEDRSYDETAHARQVATFLDAQLTVLDHGDFPGDALARLVWHVDEPFADTSIMPTYLMNRSARAHITVALSGDGADEVLAGYPTYRADALYDLYRHVPGAIQCGMERLAVRMLRPSYNKVSRDYRVRQFLRSRGMSRAGAHYWWRAIFSEQEKRSLLSPELLGACDDYQPFTVFEDYFRRVPKAAFLDQALYVDIKTWLQDDILVKVDRMSMANSLEVRCPFLDHRLVEFAAGLDTGAKMNWRRQKVVLKDCMRGVLPRSIIRRRKAGFAAPTRAYALTGSLSDRFPDLFRPGFHLDERAEDITFKSFSLTVLGIWLGLFDRYRRTGHWDAG